MLLTVDNIGRREGDTSVRGMVGTDEGRLVPGVYMWDIVAICSRVPSWYNLRLRNKMMSIEHRNVPQNTPVASKRPLLEIVRLRLVARVT